jgi:hypothetical protein
MTTDIILVLLAVIAHQLFYVRRYVRALWVNNYQLNRAELGDLLSSEDLDPDKDHPISSYKVNFEQREMAKVEEQRTARWEARKEWLNHLAFYELKDGRIVDREKAK